MYVHTHIVVYVFMSIRPYTPRYIQTTYVQTYKHTHIPAFNNKVMSQNCRKSILKGLHTSVPTVLVCLFTCVNRCGPTFRSVDLWNNGKVPPSKERTRKGEEKVGKEMFEMKVEKEKLEVAVGKEGEKRKAGLEAVKERSKDK
jgi:hypothetical protein